MKNATKISSICIDANLIVRTLVAGQYSKQAATMMAAWQQENIPLVAPSIFVFEVTSALRRLVYLKEITPEEGEEAFSRFLRIKVRLSHRRGMFPLTWHLAKQFRRSRIYDMSYLALAQIMHCPLWTADEKLYNAVKDTFSWVHWIGEAG